MAWWTLVAYVGPVAALVYAILKKQKVSKGKRESNAMGDTRRRVLDALAAEIQRQCDPGGYCSNEQYFDDGVYNMTIDSSIDLGEVADAIIEALRA